MTLMEALIEDVGMRDDSSVPIVTIIDGLVYVRVLAWVKAREKEELAGGRPVPMIGGNRAIRTELKRTRFTANRRAAGARWLAVGEPLMGWFDPDDQNDVIRWKRKHTRDSVRCRGCSFETMDHRRVVGGLCKYCRPLLEAFDTHPRRNEAVSWLAAEL